ncbi:MAG: hypothetical protein ACP5E4_02390 [Candidatus Aenigmatarchaeota archaeon]
MKQMTLRNGIGRVTNGVKSLTKSAVYTLPFVGGAAAKSDFNYDLYWDAVTAAGANETLKGGLSAIYQGRTGAGANGNLTRYIQSNGIEVYMTEYQSFFDQLNNQTVSGAANQILQGIVYNDLNATEVAEQINSSVNAPLGNGSGIDVI